MGRRRRRSGTGAAQAAVIDASEPISHPPTQGQVQALNNAVGAAVTLNELRATLMLKGLFKGDI